MWVASYFELDKWYKHPSFTILCSIQCFHSNLQCLNKNRIPYFSLGTTTYLQQSNVIYRSKKANNFVKIGWSKLKYTHFFTISSNLKKKRNMLKQNGVPVAKELKSKIGMKCFFCSLTIRLKRKCQALWNPGNIQWGVHLTARNIFIFYISKTSWTQGLAITLEDYTTRWKRAYNITKEKYLFQITSAVRFN